MNKIVALLNELIGMISECGTDELPSKEKAWLSPEGKHLFVDDVDKFYANLNAIYNERKEFYEKFSIATFNKKLDNFIHELKKKGKTATEDDVKDLVGIFSKITPQQYTVVAPIFGIRFDDDRKDLNFGPFKIGYLKDLNFPICNGGELYIGINVNDVCDNKIAQEIAQTAFADFSRIVHFLLGRFDNSHVISFGLPGMPSFSHERMYVSTLSFGLIDNNGNFVGAEVSSKIVEKLPIDNDFFTSHELLSKILHLYDMAHNNKKISKFQMKCLNSALSIGESAFSADDRNSLLFSCIALETLFSFNEESLFQRSIGEKISSLLAFVVAKTPEERLETIKFTKDVYSMRSALVHGGNKKITNKYIKLNVLLRMAIAELLNSPKFSQVNSIDDLVNMYNLAQVSY